MVSNVCGKSMLAVVVVLLPASRYTEEYLHFTSQVTTQTGRSTLSVIYVHMLKWRIATPISISHLTVSHIHSINVCPTRREVQSTASQRCVPEAGTLPVGDTVVANVTTHNIHTHTAIP